MRLLCFSAQLGIDFDDFMLKGDPVREHRGGAGGGDVFVQASLLGLPNARQC